VGEETKKMVAGFWPVYPLGPVHLKGIKDPVPVFSLLRATSPETIEQLK
jgi:class 3 adenylate cyclase